MKRALFAIIALLLAAALPAWAEPAYPLSVQPDMEIGEIALPDDTADPDPDPELELDGDALPEAEASEILPNLPGDILLDGDFIDLDLNVDGLEAGLLLEDYDAAIPNGDPAVLLAPLEEACHIDDARDSDGLFAACANDILRGGGLRANASTNARDRLNAQEKLIYDTLKPLIARVAEGERTSTEFGVPVSALLGMTRTTGRALTGAPLSNPITAAEQERVETAWKALFTYTLVDVTDALWFDCTYELYWLDRYDMPIRATKPALLSRYDADLGDWELYVADDAVVTFRFPVLARYQGDTYTLDPTAIVQAKQARDNARAIVDKYAGYPDCARLAGYVIEICNLVAYDDEAATPTWQDANPQVQDPWKLIWVFDGDKDTNAVCEGYAQAFQYLCEIDGGVRCRMVTGYAWGTTHAWNLVRMADGNNYLVDVNQMDGDWDEPVDSLADWIGANQGRLFLCGGTGSVPGGYEIRNRDGGNEGFRTYRLDTRTLYSDAALSLAPRGYTPTGFMKLPGGTWYFDANGAYVTGKAVLDGYGYRFAANGALQGKLSGWHTVDGERRFFETDGRLHTTHAPVTDEGVPATCTRPGLTRGSHCALCGTVLSAQAPIEALGHRWDAPAYAWADDLSAVTASRACLNDPAHVQSESVPTTAEVAQAPACAAKGATAYTARFTDPAFEAQRRIVRDIPATGHRWGDAAYAWADDLSAVTASRACLNDPDHVQSESVPTTARVAQAPTCTARGATLYTARFVNTAFAPQSKRVRNISATGHTPVDDPAVPPTASKEGLTEGSHCAVCGRVLTAQKRVPRLEAMLRLSGSACRRASLGKALRIVVTGGQIRRCKSSDPSVAAVSRKGRVTPRRPGKATITIRLADGRKLQLKLTVVDPLAPRSVRIAQGRRAALKVGQRLTLKAVLRPARARSTLAWASSNPRVASVSRSGVVKARRAGHATIFVRTANGKHAAVSVTVKP